MFTRSSVSAWSPRSSSLGPSRFFTRTLSPVSNELFPARRENLLTMLLHLVAARFVRTWKPEYLPTFAFDGSTYVRSFCALFLFRCAGSLLVALIGPLAWLIYCSAPCSYTSVTNTVIGFLHCIDVGSATVVQSSPAMICHSAQWCVCRSCFSPRRLTTPCSFCFHVHCRNAYLVPAIIFLVLEVMLSPLALMAFLASR
jgi:hypothetical protein